MNLCRVKFRDHQRLTRGELSEYSVPTYKGMGDVPRAGNDSGGGQLGNAIHCKPHGAERLALHRRAGSGVDEAREAHRARRRRAGSRERSALRQDRRPAQEPELMWTLINKFAEKYTKRELMEILNPLDVPCGPIMSTEDLANDEHVRGRDMWVELDHPQRGKWWNVGMPIKLSASPAEIERSPTLGEHTDEVLKEVLGYRRREGRQASEERRRVLARRQEGRLNMKIAIIGQQDFGKAVLEAFLDARRRGRGRVLRAGEARREGRPAARRGARRRASRSSSSSRCASDGRARGAESARTSISASWRTCCSSRPTASRRSRGSARSSITRRCCRSTAARRRSTGRSSAATRAPASRSSARTKASTKVRSCCRRSATSVRTRRSATSTSTSLFPMGVQAMLEAADLVAAGKHTEARAGRIAGDLRRLVPRRRGAHPLGEPRRLRLQPDPRLQPGARRVDDAERPRRSRFSTRASTSFRRFADVTGKIGEVSDVTDTSFRVTAQGGRDRSAARAHRRWKKDGRRTRFRRSGARRRASRPLACVFPL